VDLRNQSRATQWLLAGSLLLTMGCATTRYDAHGNPYYAHYDHQHATEGAIVGGLAGAGIGRVIAGHDDDEAGYWIGGALGAITGAVVGDAMDREKDRARHAPYPDGPPPPRRGRHDGDWGSHDGGYEEDWRSDDDYRDSDPYAYEPPPSPVPLFLNLPDEVLFAPGSDRLEPGAKRRLRDVAKALRKHPATQAVIRGHASTVERRDGALSDARSRAVREYLVRQGVAPSRVTALGMGARFPVASDRTAEGRQRNRRAEIEIHSDRGHDLARLW